MQYKTISTRSLIPSALPLSAPDRVKQSLTGLPKLGLGAVTAIAKTSEKVTDKIT